MPERLEEGAPAGEPDKVDRPTLDQANVGQPTADAVPEALPLDGDEAVPFGDYELLGELGRGGMGVVYRARDRHSGQIVALKMMLNERAPRSTELRRFKLEARATSELNHPGIIAIHSWGEHEGHLFYTMDYVAGQPLGRLMEKARLSYDQAVRYLVGIARAVAVAHEQGIVHRDLKPGNVIVDANGQPRVLDFGLAKRQRPVAGDVSGVDSVADVLPVSVETVAQTIPVESDSYLDRAASQAPRATEQGAILGTPSYMAPEQASGEQDRVCPATDVHALGAIFYEMLMGRPPFQGSSVLDTLRQLKEREPEDMWIRGRRVPALLEAVCRRCLQKEPRDRYPDAGALADDLERKWEHARQGKRFGLLALGSVTTGFLLAATYLLLSQHTVMSLESLNTWAATAGPAAEDAATLLTLLLKIVLFWGAPALALVTALATLVAWVWHEERTWLMASAGAGSALGAGLVLLTGLGQLQLLLALILACVATVMGVTWMSRLVFRSDWKPAEAKTLKTDPFLHRLFAARGEPRGKKKGIRSAQPAVTGLADIEMGKVIHEWDGGLVRRGRQRSFDRPVLFWLDKTPAPADAPLPGVSVRHPLVLGLHAVGTCPEGRYLVTEFVAATPLTEILQRETLPADDAVHLMAELAQAVQAIHDQGACLGIFRPEWIMRRGDREPLLCPWCVPSPLSEDRIRDGRALGRLLLEWLPPRPRRWQRQPFAGVYEVCDAAKRGSYSRMADLANDLTVALREAVIRRREQLIAFCVVVLALVPWLYLAVEFVQGIWGQAPARVMAQHLIQALVPCAVLLGYTHARTLVHRQRLRYTVRLSGKRRGLLTMLGQVMLLTVPPGLVSWNSGAGLCVAVLLLGFWLVGMGIAGLTTVAFGLFRNLRPLLARLYPEQDLPE